MSFLKRAWFWALGELPDFQRTPDSAPLLWWICGVSCIGMLLGTEHSVRGHPLIFSFWRMTVHGMLPLLVVACWYTRKAKGLRWSAILGSLLILAPIVYRLTGKAALLHIRQNNWVLMGPVLIGAAFCLFAIWRSETSFEEWGMGVGDWRWWGPRALICLAILIPCLVLVMKMNSNMARFYPTWRPARTDSGAFAILHLGLAIDFIGWELLFRAFLLFAVARRGDAMTAIWLQAIPFFLLHGNKPYMELVSSLPGGLLAAWFCLRARSFWPLFLIHWVQITTVGASGFLMR